MMATAPFNRLLWKELRVLRNVWLMCGLGVTFLMLVILAIGESTDHSQGYSAAFWVFMVWVPPVYVLAALATMFAGEREEGTLVWLTALAPRLSTVVTSRLLFVIATGIGLQAWYGLSALLLSQFDEPIVVGPTDSEENLIIMSFLLVEALAFGMFWSLQTNRPLNAILYAAITVILVNSAATMLTEAFGGRVMVRPQDAVGYALGFWGWGRCLLVLAVFVADWKLAGQWLDGRPWDWEWTAAWWSRRRVKAAAGTNVAVLPSDATEPWRRAWQRLRWLEWQGLRSFAWITLGFTLVSCFSVMSRVQGRPTWGFTFAICWLVILIGGLMSWHGEQAQQRFRALVRLGVSPIAMWTNKLACWFTATVLAITTIQGVTAMWWTILSALGRPNDAGYHVPLRTLWAQMLAAPQAQAAVLTLACYCLTLFAIGFTCAHLFRKTVLSMGTALIGAALVSPWFFVSGYYGLPWYFFFAPLPIWLLWISASTMPAWWIEQTTWRVSYRRLGTLVLQSVVPFALLALAAGYSVWEVPTLSLTESNIVRPNDLIMNAVHAGNPEGVRTAWKEIMGFVHEPLVIPSEIEIPEEKSEIYWRQPKFLIQFGEDEETARRALVNANRKSIDEITSRVLTLGTLPVRKPSVLDDNWVHLYAPLTLYSAQIALQDGQMEESLRYLHAAARLSGMVRRLTPPTRITAFAPPHFQTEMIRWAQHPQQTEEALRRGLQLCASELRFWQTQPEELEFTRDEELRQTQGVYWPWERSRARKLVDVAYSNRVQYLRMCRNGHMQPAFDSTAKSTQAARFYMQPGDIRLEAWNFTPVEGRGRYFDWQEPVYGLEPGFIDSMFTGENQFRATLALMAVVGHRRLQGELPGSLFEIEKYFEQTLPPGPKTTHLALAMNDVWTGASFGYAPRGFPLHEPEFPADSVYRQPLLWTAESRQYRLGIHNNQIERKTNWYGIWSNADIRQDSVSDDKSWVFPIPPQDTVPVME